MFREKTRYGQNPAIVTRSKPPTFNQPLKWQRQAAAGDRQGADRLVFACSWSDWFEPAADPWRGDAWDIVRRCPDLIFQLLTKLPEKVFARLPSDWGSGYPNVWIGVSAENQTWTDLRCHILGRIPAAVRFVSYEPAIGPVEWGEQLVGSRIDWVIAGGESGPDARPFNLNWARRVQEQCQAAGAAFFFKQTGENAYDPPEGAFEWQNEAHRLLAHEPCPADLRDAQGFPAAFQPCLTDVK